MKNACYTSPLPAQSSQMPSAWAANMPSFTRLLRRKLLIYFLACTAACFATAQEPPSTTQWNDSAPAFVREVLNRAGSPSSIAVVVENRSALSDADALQIKRAIETQFRAAKIRIVSPETALAVVKLQLSENLAGYLWVAEIQQGLTKQNLLMPVERKIVDVSAARAPALLLQKTIVFSTSQSLLDFAQVDANHWIVVQPEGVAFISADMLRQSALQNSLASPQLHTVSATHSQPWPRDLRVHLLLGPSGTFDVFYPGVQCSGNTSVTNAISCMESDDPWPLSPLNQPPLNGFFSGTRNFYTGALVGAGSYPVPAFFSAASIGDGAGRIWIFANTDGRARIFNRLNASPMKVVNGWGSDLAAVRSNCGFGWQLLATTPGDSHRADSIQAFEIVNKDPVPVTASLDLSGPVVSLWSASDNSSANAVIWNLSSKKYEAVNLSISCGK